MPQAKAVTISIPVPMDKIHGAIVSAFEGGADYWLHSQELLDGFRKPDSKLVWWGHEEVFKQPFKAQIRFDDPTKEEGNGEGVRVITNADLQRGLALMATKAPRHFADLLSDQADQVTGDVLLQMIALEDIVYD